MNVKLKARLALAKMVIEKFSQVATDKGELYYDEDGQIEVGTEVYVYDEDQNPVIPEDGDYDTEDRILTVVAGIVTEIKDKETEVVEEELEEDVVVEESISVADFKELEAKFEALAALVKEIAGEVDGVDERVGELDSEFKKALSTSGSKPAQEQIEIVQGKEQSQLGKFGL